MEWWSVADAAEELGISPRTVRWRIAHGEMKAERIGKRTLLIPRSEIDRWRSLGKLKPGPKQRNYSGRAGRSRNA